MGYRFQSRMAEEQPVFAPQAVDPGVFLAARQRGAQQQIQQSQQNLQAELQNNQMNLDSTRDFWNSAAGAVDKGIGAYRTAKKDAQDARRFESEESMSREELAGKKRQNMLGDKYDARRAESDIKNLDATANVNTAAAEEATAKRDFDKIVDPVTGKSNQQRSLDAGLKTTETNAALADKQLDNEVMQLKIAQQKLDDDKTMSPLVREEAKSRIAANLGNLAASRQQLKVAQLGITKEEREQRVQGYTARLIAPKPGENPVAILQAMEREGASPTEMAIALSNVKDKEANKKMLDGLNPLNQQETGKIVMGRDLLTEAQEGLSTLDNAIAEYKASTLAKDDGRVDASLETIKRVAEDFGLAKQGEDVQSFFTRSGWGREGRMDELAMSMRKAAAAKLKPYAATDEKLQSAYNDLLKKTLTVAPNTLEHKGFKGLNFNPQPQQQAPQMQFINNQAPMQQAPMPAGAGLAGITGQVPQQPQQLPPLGNAWKRNPQTTTQAKR